MIAIQFGTMMNESIISNDVIISRNNRNKFVEAFKRTNIVPKDLSIIPVVCVYLVVAEYHLFREDGWRTQKHLATHTITLLCIGHNYSQDIHPTFKPYIKYNFVGAFRAIWKRTSKILT